jgi:hypothetical protein
MLMSFNERCEERLLIVRRWGRRLKVSRGVLERRHITLLRDHSLHS